MPLVHIEGNSVTYGESIIIRIHPRKDALVSLHRAQFVLTQYPPARRCTAALTKGVHLLMTCPVVHSSHSLKNIFYQGHHSTFLVKETFMLQMTVENGATGDLGDMAPELKKMSLSTDCSVKCKRLLIGRKNPTRLWITLHFSHGKNTWNGLSTSWRCPSSPPWEAKIQQPRQVELELRRSRPILNSRD